MKIAHFATTRTEYFQPVSAGKKRSGTVDSRLVLKGRGDQTILGFGGCFNELGWIALNRLDQGKREEILDLLFDPETDGLHFNFCRLPIGASDYAADWYSHNEREGDYAMEHFSIARDRRFLLPYIREAFGRTPAMKLFASPWSPPTWMKSPRAYNYGTLIQKKENLEAYALYFARFIESYREEGVRIDQVHVQNEPMVSQKFPSCRWTGDEFASFIGQYLGPCFEERRIDSEIWLGTLNGPEPDFFKKNLSTGYNDYANLVLHDRDARKYVKGVGYQWAGKYAVRQTHAAWPEIGLMQTENECGDGSNSWSYARYVFDLFLHYLSNGVNAYIYWNMVLEEGGESTWGWKQNSLITVDPEKGEYRINPEFYVMKHFSAFVEEGDVREETAGPFASNSVAFRKRNGDLILILFNPFDREMDVEIETPGRSVVLTLPADSFNTAVITY